MNKDICLVVIFNHRYDKNLAVLEEMYSSRFSNRYYLVPFYDGEQANVIPVYGRSIFFEGYIAQGYNVFFHESFKHYLFVADDMIINPEINEENYQEFFEVGTNQSFIPELRPVHKFGPWIGTWSSVFYFRKQKYVEVSNELPTIEFAKQKMGFQGVMLDTLTRKQIFGRFSFNLKSLGAKASCCLRIVTKVRHPFKKRYELPYPMVGSYSDIALVSSSDIKKFAHYCGVFASTCLFVEVAIPTALVLATSLPIQTEKKMKRHGRSYWLTSDNVFCEKPDYTWENLEKEYKNLDDLIERFPKDAIYIHPVKLSKWTKK